MCLCKQLDSQSSIAHARHKRILFVTWRGMDANYYDVIIVGAGIEGSWTALQLALRKRKVLLLEQFGLPHRNGCSTGKSRIILNSYQSQCYVQMMPEAFRMWKELERKTNKSLLVDSELISIFPDDGLKKISDNLNSTSVCHEFVKNVDIEEKYPGLCSPKLNAVVENCAGILRADECLHTVQELFKSEGGVLRDSEKVVQIQPLDGSNVKITSTKETYRCGSVVVACGPWANKVLEPLGVKIPAKITRIYSVYWKATNPELYKQENGFPIIILENEDGDHFYSIPILEYPGLIKVCYHGVGIEVDPDSDIKDPLVYGGGKSQLIKDLVQNHFTNLAPEPVVVEPCMQMATPDKDYVLDFHPNHKNIVIAAGFSGHGFKLSPVVGDILCSLALNEKPHYPVDKFNLSRFSV